MICGDERKVKQVLLNLLSNALKFTPEGGQIGVQAELRMVRQRFPLRIRGWHRARRIRRRCLRIFDRSGRLQKKWKARGSASPSHANSLNSMAEELGGESIREGLDLRVHAAAAMISRAAHYPEIWLTRMAAHRRQSGHRERLLLTGSIARYGSGTDKRSAASNGGTASDPAVRASVTDVR